jgi:hypothetical protein
VYRASGYRISLSTGDANACQYIRTIGAITYIQDNSRLIPPKYVDPDLPQELLPENWLRPQAAALFDEYNDSLSEKANEYFDSVSENYQGARRP